MVNIITKIFLIYLLFISYSCNDKSDYLINANDEMNNYNSVTGSGSGGSGSGSGGSGSGSGGSGSGSGGSGSGDTGGACTEEIDCLGFCGGEATYDACGVCDGDYSSCTGCSDINACNYDPQAIIVDNYMCEYAEEFFDCNGICLFEVDCNGVCNGISSIDDCGICNGNGEPCEECPDGLNPDCNGVCGGNAVIDDCGICNGNNESCTGCFDTNACNYDPQTIIIDYSLCEYPEEFFDCSGTCIANIDCLGVCGGIATVDACGICNGDGSMCGNIECENLNQFTCNSIWQCEWDDGECEEKDCDEYSFQECMLVTSCEWDDGECEENDDGSGSGSGSGSSLGEGPTLFKNKFKSSKYKDNPKLF